MNEKIEQYAKGIFEYSAPAVVFDPPQLQITVDAGEIYHGSFFISNEKKRAMRGVVCTDCSNLVLKEETFRREENEISFLFRGTYCRPGEVVRGTIQVLSDCGSARLSFTAAIIMPSCDASTGKLRDLNQFAHLARENMAEALRLFYSSHFEGVFLSGNVVQRELYRGLSKGNDRGAAMEEFLITIHKKVPVRLTVEKRELQYPKCENIFADHIILHKDSWGYCQYTVRSDAAFIRPEHSFVRTTDFAGDTYALAFVVDPSQMAVGHNFARITIENVRQSIAVNILARRFCISDQDRRQHIRQQKGIWDLCRNFLWYHAGRLPWKDYSAAAEQLIRNLDVMLQGKGGYDWLVRAFRIHLALKSHKEGTFRLEMAQLESQLDILREEQPFLYCSYYYLFYLWRPEEAKQAGALHCIQDCYQVQEHHWLVLWFLLQIDGAYPFPVRRQEAILEQLIQGVRSPFLYLELCRLYNTDPELLTELTAEREQALHWGCCRDLLEKEVRFRYAYMISRQRSFSALMLEDLCHIYETEPSDDLLTMICQMMMRERKGTADSLKWYRLGIEHSIKLTELYEYYMYALEESPDLCLPDKVLLYFSYDNQLGAPKKAMLYAYIVRHKDQDKATYDDYYPVMQQFALEQMGQGRISESLAVIYEEFITEEDLTEEAARGLPMILFSREITCHDPNIVEVVVRHPQIRQEEHARLVNGKAIVPVFTEAAQIFLVDREGNRYAGSVDYTSHRMLHLEHLAAACLAFVGDNVRILLYLCDKAVRRTQTGERMAELRKRVLEISGLEPEYRKKVFAAQMQYYFNNFQGELLEHYLNQMDWEDVAPGDRKQFIEYCAVRHCYDKAMEGIVQFGYDRMDARRLLQISSHAFQGAGEDAFLVKLAWHIFQGGQFDTTMLRYLCDYYTGSVQELVQLWKAATGFEMDVPGFAERILSQILFTDEMCPEAYDIFFLYEEEGFDKKLVRAFFKRAAYCYLVRGEELPEKMFSCFYRHVQVEENRPCLLAVLRYMSRKEKLEEGEAAFVDYNIHKLFEENIVFGFFQDFSGKVMLPGRVLREEYVEYIADPSHDVRIWYRLCSEGRSEKMVTETMADMFGGIRVHGFTLFRDEKLEYQIIDRDPDGGEVRTEMAQLHYVDRIKDEDGVNAYRMLNRIMSLQAEGDERALFSLMREYMAKREAVKLLLKPI